MKQETSQWGKAVKKAVIDHDMTLKQLAEKIGYSNATVSQVVNGRYSNSSYNRDLEQRGRTYCKNHGMHRRKRTCRGRDSDRHE